MPKKSHKDRYLEEHQRTICPGCLQWVLWYYDKKGKKVFGCELGLIPYRDKCPSFKDKRSRQAATVGECC